MTAARPEHQGRAPGGPYGSAEDGRYGPAPDAAGGVQPTPQEAELQAAVEALADPLQDPLPGREHHSGQRNLDAEEGAAQQRDQGEVSPWFRTNTPPSPGSAGPGTGRDRSGQPQSGPPRSGQPQHGTGAQHGTDTRHSRQPQQGWDAPQGPDLPQGPVPQHNAPAAAQREAWRGASEPLSVPRHTVDWGSAAPGDPDAPDAQDAAQDRRTVGLRTATEPVSETGGRAARRRAAKANRGWRALLSSQPASGGSAPVPASAGTRLEARRAARANRAGPGVIASRFFGEAFITLGVLMLLFVAYQLWWTNVLADQKAGGATEDLQHRWQGNHPAQADPQRRAGRFAPGEGFAIIHLPKLGIDTPIAQGVSKPDVLDKGMVGHYDRKPLKTAMPWDRQGNFALAAHRNTHGEPFRYINRLVTGDEIVVETATKFYTYRMTSRLASTSPSNTSVIDPVPAQSGFRKPGRYVTLTTCTPEFTSKYRLIVWGRMVDERPRSAGKPDALVD